MAGERITLCPAAAASRYREEVCPLFKAFARALRMALEIDPRQGGALPSTKGAL